MTTELKQLLIAVGSFLEWKADPRGFTGEPIYNLAQSYIDYLQATKDDLPWPGALHDFELHFGDILREIRKPYDEYKKSLKQ